MMMITTTTDDDDIVVGSGVIIGVCIQEWSSLC